MPSPTIVAEALAGALLVIAALADVFMTILVPGPVGGRLRMVRLVRTASLPVWRRAARARHGRDRRPHNGFAPMTLALTFAAWMLLLLGGYALLLHAVSWAFRPRAPSIGDAIWIAGSSLVTLGVSEFDAQGIARWLILACGLSGFSALTASVTFMLQIQSSLHQREPAVMALVGMAGAPPSGVRILQTFAELGDAAQLGPFFTEWRDWSAAVLHSHLTYPVLSYYRSLDAQNDWLAALEAVLDAATLVMAAVDHPARGTATLMHRAGARTASQLRALFDVTALDVTCERDEARRAVAMVAEAGYALRDDVGDAGEHAAKRFLSLRSDYAGDLEALARHLGANRAALVPMAEAEGAA